MDKMNPDPVKSSGYTRDLELKVSQLQAELTAAQEQAERLRVALSEAREAFRKYEWDVEDDPTPEHRAMIWRIDVALGNPVCCDLEANHQQDENGWFCEACGRDPRQKKALAAAPSVDDDLTNEPVPQRQCDAEGGTCPSCE